MSCYCPPSCAIPSCPQPCSSQPCSSQPCSSQPCSSQPCSSQPSCPQPSCSTCSYPVGGLGSLSCCPSSGCSSSCCGTSTSARCLGITSGANVACVNQIPPSEMVIQPPPCIVTIPGAVLAATCEPVRVGGYSACAGCSPCGRICNSPC